MSKNITHRKGKALNFKNKIEKIKKVKNAKTTNFWKTVGGYKVNLETLVPRMKTRANHRYSRLSSV